jgi:TetR/AcrR family transcriptional regulator, transcriptional repressor for nem operon
MPRTTPVRDRILDAAHELVIARGFDATTVDAIIDAAGASKGAFFHHFESKPELGRALVERYAAADRVILDQFISGAEGLTQDPARQLVELVRQFETAADRIALSQPGCLFVSFVYESVADTDGIRLLIVDAIEHWRTRIADKLERAAAAGKLPPDIDIPSLADHVFTTFEGAFILARATGDPGHVRAQIGHLRRYLELVLNVDARVDPHVELHVDAATSRA